MGDRGQVRLCAIFLLTNLLSYYVYNPVPDTLEEPWKYTAGVVGSMRILDDVAKVVDALGLQDYLTFKQNVVAGFLSLQQQMVPHDPDVNVTDTEFLGVPVRIYQPQRDSSDAHQGAVVYLHGGGFTMLNVNAYDAYLQRYVHDAGVVVMAIDYRLAPQHPSPAAMEDCMHAARHFLLYARNRGVDPARVGVAGDGAGANLALATTLAFNALQERSMPNFSYMVLLYPWLQAIDLNTPSMQQNERHSMPDVTRRGLASHTLAYLGLGQHLVRDVITNNHTMPTSKAHHAKSISFCLLPPELVHQGYAPVGQTEVDESVALLTESGVLDPYNFPLMAESLAGLPATFVATMGHDTLRDDGFWLVRRLTTEGVTVRHYHDKKSFHGVGLFIDGLLDFQAAHRLMHQVLKFIAVFS